MDVSLLFKIAAVGLIVAVLNQFLNKADRGEYAFFVTVAGIAAVAVILLDRVTELFSAMKSVFGL